MTVHDEGADRQDWRVAIRTHVRVVSALVRREMQAHFESRLGYLWALFMPAMHLGGFMLVFTYLIKRHVPLGTSTSLFLLTAIVPFFLFSRTASYVSAAVGSNRSLLILPPVKVFDVVVARVVLEATTYLFVGFFMLFILYLGGVTDAMPHNPHAVMEACILAISLGLGLGMVNIVVLSYIHTWMVFYGMFTFPLWMFSGIWFLPEQLPEPIREYALYNPVMHIVLMFRKGFYPNYDAVYLDASYATLVSALALALGLALMQVARRRVLDPI